MNFESLVGHINQVQDVLQASSSKSKSRHSNRSGGSNIYSIGGSQRWRDISTCPLGLKRTPSSSKSGRWRLQPGAVRPSLLTTR